MSKQPRNLRQQRRLTPNLAPEQMSKKETLQTAESLLLMQELARVVVNSGEVAREIQDQAQEIQRLMRTLQGK